MDLASQVKSMVTMPDVLSAYGFDIKRSSKAICPFHDDKNASMHIYRDGYHCYACGAYGDVIDFVRHYFNLTYMDAVKKMNADMMLGIPFGESLDRSAIERANRAARERKLALERQNAEQARLEAEYHKWFDLWIKLDKIKKEQFPQNFLEDITDEYAKACRNLDYVNYRVELALQKLSACEQKVKEIAPNLQQLNKNNKNVQGEK